MRGYALMLKALILLLKMAARRHEDHRIPPMGKDNCVCECCDIRRELEVLR